MGDIAYLVAGYAVFIGISLVYIISLVNRQKQLQKELQSIKMIAQEE
jgi:hypothetical protein